MPVKPDLFMLTNKPTEDNDLFSRYLINRYTTTRKARKRFLKDKANRGRIIYAPSNEKYSTDTKK